MASASDNYRHIEEKLTGDECVVLDGGVSTELQRLELPDYHLSDSELWGTAALYHAPHAVLEVHRRYAAAGCDLITTNTWGLLDATSPTGLTSIREPGLRYWLDAAQLGVRLARQGIETAGANGKCAVAFSISGDLDQPERLGSLELLQRAFRDDSPDLILVETLSLVPDDLEFTGIEGVLAIDLPVWLSYRRCRHGVCGVYGQHWGGPEGDLFGRAARKLEKLGAGALLINCLPIDHVPGMLSWLRDFTDLPLGVYPNLGRYLDPDWKFDEAVEPDDYAELALQWRDEGAQIVGGCCGVTPEHIDAARKGLAGTKPGISQSSPIHLDAASSGAQRLVEPWADKSGERLFPLPFPEIVCDPGVFRPTPGSFLVWKYLFQQRIGRD